jgi:hypothetical protein
VVSRDRAGRDRAGRDRAGRDRAGRDRAGRDRAGRDRAGRDGDLAGRLLRAVVRMMPAERGEWGRAMRAELASIGPARERLSFAAGCLRAVAGAPAAYRRVGYCLLVAGVLVAAASRAAALAYLPLRLGLVALVGVLVVVSWLGRRRGPLGPVGRSWPARGVRVAGYVLVVALTLGLLPNLGKDPDQASDAARIAPVFTVVLATFLVGFLALTTDRSAADARVLAAGAGSGVAATAVWAVAAVVFRPIPTSIAATVFLVAAGMVAAALAGGGRSGSHGGHGRGLLAALSAGVIGALLIFQLVLVLSTFGPPSLIPDLAAPALTAADDLAQSRDEIQDPYVAVAFGGFLLAALLSIAAFATRRPGPVPRPSTADGQAADSIR